MQDKKYSLVISLDDDVEACEIASLVKSDELIGAYINGGERKYTESSAVWFDMGLISKFGKEKADKLKAKNKRTYQEIICDILNAHGVYFKVVSYGSREYDKDKRQQWPFVLNLEREAVLV